VTSSNGPSQMTSVCFGDTSPSQLERVTAEVFDHKTALRRQARTSLLGSLHRGRLQATLQSVQQTEFTSDRSQVPSVPFGDPLHASSCAHAGGDPRVDQVVQRADASDATAEMAKSDTSLKCAADCLSQLCNLLMEATASPRDIARLDHAPLLSSPAGRAPRSLEGCTEPVVSTVSYREDLGQGPLQSTYSRRDHRLGSLRRCARNSLMRAARDGRLEPTLETAKGNDSQSVGRLASLRGQARASLTRAAHDGRLEPTLEIAQSSASSMRPPAPLPPETQIHCEKPNYSSEGLRRRDENQARQGHRAQSSRMCKLRGLARASLTRAVRDGRLEPTLEREQDGLNSSGVAFLVPPHTPQPVLRQSADCTTDAFDRAADYLQQLLGLLQQAASGSGGATPRIETRSSPCRIPPAHVGDIEWTCREDAGHNAPPERVGEPGSRNHPWSPQALAISSDETLLPEDHSRSVNRLRSHRTAVRASLFTAARAGSLETALERAMGRETDVACEPSWDGLEGVSRKDRLATLRRRAGATLTRGLMGGRAGMTLETALLRSGRVEQVQREHSDLLRERRSLPTHGRARSADVRRCRFADDINCRSLGPSGGAPQQASLEEEGVDSDGDEASDTWEERPAKSVQEAHHVPAALCRNAIVTLAHAIWDGRLQPPLGMAGRASLRCPRRRTDAEVAPMCHAGQRCTGEATSPCRADEMAAAYLSEETTRSTAAAAEDSVMELEEAIANDSDSGASLDPTPRLTKFMPSGCLEESKPDGCNWPSARSDISDASTTATPRLTRFMPAGCPDACDTLPRRMQSPRLGLIKSTKSTAQLMFDDVLAVGSVARAMPPRDPFRPASPAGAAAHAVRWLAPSAAKGCAVLVSPSHGKPTIAAHASGHEQLRVVQARSAQGGGTLPTAPPTFPSAWAPSALVQPMLGGHPRPRASICPTDGYAWPPRLSAPFASAPRCTEDYHGLSELTPRLTCFVPVT